ncbi:MAG TPA: LuxR C-terminal-related transcriptional regulator [Mycobacterium sp.]|nr:LuxR C-terminal-related transcriptional regulator [Mycobacterium sp.]
MTTATLPDCDLHALITLLEDARRDDPGEVVPWALLEGLAKLIHADVVQLCDMDWVEESLVAKQDFADGERAANTSRVKNEDTAAYFRSFRNFRACGDPVRPETPGAGRWSDYYTDIELRNTEAYVEFFGPRGDRTNLGVRLPSPPGRARRVRFVRQSFTHFTDRDVMLLSLLRPHLHEIYLDAERRRNGVPKLTAREWEILQLAGEGLPNAAIGQQLFISPATVRKHMEHIFDSLGVRTRAEAAAIALPHRPVAAAR